jgi:hypothetical protein
MGTIAQSRILTNVSQSINLLRRPAREALSAPRIQPRCRCPVVASGRRCRMIDPHGASTWRRAGRDQPIGTKLRRDVGKYEDAADRAAQGAIDPGAGHDLVARRQRQMTNAGLAHRAARRHFSRPSGHPPKRAPGSLVGIRWPTVRVTSLTSTALLASKKRWSYPSALSSRVRAP